MLMTIKTQGIWLIEYFSTLILELESKVINFKLQSFLALSIESPCVSCFWKFEIILYNVQNTNKRKYPAVIITIYVVYRQNFKRKYYTLTKYRNLINVNAFLYEGSLHSLYVGQWFSFMLEENKQTVYW